MIEFRPNWKQWNTKHKTKKETHRQWRSCRTRSVCRWRCSPSSRRCPAGREGPGWCSPSHRAPSSRWSSRRSPPPRSTGRSRRTGDGRRTRGPTGGPRYWVASGDAGIGKKSILINKEKTHWRISQGLWASEFISQSVFNQNPSQSAGRVKQWN